MRKLTIALLLATISTIAQAGSVTVAVASNFSEPLREIAGAFSTQTGHDVRISTGSTGYLYAQIVNGAPYDVFLSADVSRAQLLEGQSLAVPGSRFTYAVGQLMLWSRDVAVSGEDCMPGLAALGNRKLAIANPLLAPYGVAAKQFLQRQGLWTAVEGNLVLGENVAQAFQFAASGSAGMAIISYAQRESASAIAATCVQRIPSEQHDPIRQQAVQLRSAPNSEVATRFLEFLRGEAARRIIAASGYQLPEPLDTQVSSQ